MYTDRAIRTGPQPSSVSPNPKCDGCLHYLSQAGPTGACEIGEKPFKCGDGSDPGMGYAPVTATGPTYPSDHAAIGQADAGPGPNAGLERMKIEVLGEEQASMVKSIANDFEKGQREQCTFHHQRGNVLQQNTNLAYTEAKCSCREVADMTVAKSFSKKLTNRQRSYVGDAEILQFVSDVRKGEGSHGGKIIGHTKSGKPIYQSKKPSEYAGFSERDHKDAAQAHHVKMMQGGGHAAESHHTRMSNMHSYAADDAKKNG